jgi:hypothetical protein
LVELLIVVTVLPLIVGGLSVGLLSMFSLQSSVSNRLGDSGDSQVVASTFNPDVQSALALSTQSGTTDQCGPGTETQLLGLASNPLSGGAGGYGTIISYAEVATGSTWSLVRQYCSSTTGTAYSSTPTTTTTVSYNVEQPCTSTVTTLCQAPPTVYDLSGTECGTGGSVGTTCGWIPIVNSSSATLNVSRIEFPLAEPNTTETNGAYQYTLDAVPAAATPLDDTGGSGVTTNTTSGCSLATPGTGYYATSLCFLDFTSLTGNNLLAAESYNPASGVCGYQMAAALPGGSTMYFCLGITGGPVEPVGLPAWATGSFLGNSCSANQPSCTGGTPFYTGVTGEPALYQTSNGTTTHIFFSDISVLNATGSPATGWQVVSVDAESTDSNESLTWTADTPLSILSNDETWDTPSDPVGTACGGSSGVGGSGLTLSSNDLTATCLGYTTSVVKTGAAMISATTPTTMEVTMVGNGLEAIAFGVLI